MWVEVIIELYRHDPLGVWPEDIPTRDPHVLLYKNRHYCLQSYQMYTSTSFRKIQTYCRIYAHIYMLFRSMLLTIVFSISSLIIKIDGFHMSEILLSNFPNFNAIIKIAFLPVSHFISRVRTVNLLWIL